MSSRYGTQEMTETIEIQIEDCYPDYAGDREPSIPSLDELSEEDEVMIEMTKDIEKSKYLRERAEKRLNEGDLPEAKKLLWIDRAEVYSLCSSHYHEKKEGAWTGSTEHPTFEELRRNMNERLQSGVPCSSCRHDRIEELKAEIEEEIEISIEVVEDG